MEMVPEELKKHIMEVHAGRNEDGNWDAEHDVLDKRGAKWVQEEMWFQMCETTHAGDNAMVTCTVVLLCKGAVNDGIYVKCVYQLGEWHFRVFHFVKERKFVFTLGAADDCKISFTAHTDSIRGLSAWSVSDPTKARRDKGFHIKQERVATMANGDGKVTCSIVLS